VVEAFALPWRRRAVFVKALLLPAVALVALKIGWWIAVDDMPRWMSWAAWAGAGALWILFAVTCHRVVLLDLHASDVRLVPGWGRRETLFLLWLAVIYAVVLALGWVIFMVVVTVVGNVWTQATWFLDDELLNYGWLVLATYLFARGALVLPAAAIDARMSLPQAVRLTHRNGWRMVLVVGFLPWGFHVLARLIYGDEPNIPRGAIITALATLFLVVEISALSLCYRELTKTGDRPQL
jgi:hypothetical protein